MSALRPARCAACVSEVDVVRSCRQEAVGQADCDEEGEEVSVEEFNEQLGKELTEEQREEIRQKMLAVGKVVRKIEAAIDTQQPLRLKVKEVNQLFQWIVDLQNIATVTQQQLENLAEAYVALQASKSNQGGLWTPPR